MMWTQKEASLLEDLKKQEQLCVDKYDEYAQRANDPELTELFHTMRGIEAGHLNTISNMINGQMPQQQSQQQGQQSQQVQQQSQQTSSGMAQQSREWQADAYLCQDALATEKQVSSAYDTAVFEFRSPQARQVLNGIQGAEQHHGEMIFAYMARNGMYQAQ